MRMGMKFSPQSSEDNDMLSMEEWENIKSCTLSCWILLELLAFLNRVLPSSDQEQQQQCQEFGMCLQYFQCCCNYFILVYYHL